MRLKIVLLILCTLFVFSDCAIAVAASQEKPLVMGVFPRRSATVTIRMFKPLAEYLSQQLGRKVQLVTKKNFAQFWKGVKDRTFDIVHFNQYQYLVSHKKYGYEVILKNEEFGRSTLAGALVVRKDSKINTIQDLKGRRIAFGGSPKSMISYIVPRYLLLQAGLKHSDYKEVFTNNPPNAVYSTFYKQSDVAGTSNAVFKLDVVYKNIDVSQLKYLAVSKGLAHFPWAVKKSMDDKLCNKIKLLMLRLNDSDQGRRILANAKLTGLVAARDAEYNDLRKIVKAINGENY